MLRILFTGALALSMLTVPSSNAEACLHSMKRNVDRDMQRLVRAEKALKQGRYKRAFNLAQRAHSGAIDLAVTKGNTRGRRPRVRRIQRPTPMMQSLDRRAIRVMAVATVRLDGKTGLAVKIAGIKDAGIANLKWAVKQLREASDRRQHDSLIKTRLGEALAKLPSKQKEALEVLESLAKEDFLADAHGYAAFAKVLSANGDEGAIAEALKRCRAMASKKSICKL